MGVILRYFDRTCLNEEAFKKLVRKYSSNFEYDVVIVFDLRIKDFGQYIFDTKRQVHLVSISPHRCGFDENGKKLDDGAEKYHLISTTIHELFHAQQFEDKGREFWQNRYRCAEGVENPEAADFFSKCEIEARTYENKNLIKAVEYYDSCVDE